MKARVVIALVTVLAVGALVALLLGADTSARSEFPEHSPQEWNALAISVGYGTPSDLAPGAEAEPVIQYVASCLNGHGLSARIEQGGIAFDGEPGEVAECYHQLADEAASTSAGWHAGG